MNSPSQVRKAITSCLVTRSMASIFSILPAGSALSAAIAFLPPSQIALAASLGMTPSSAMRVAGMRLDLEPDAEAVLGRPDGGHLRPRIARDHGGLLAPKLSRRHVKKCPIMKPLCRCPRAILAAVRGVLTDIDETVSTDGR